VFMRLFLMMAMVGICGFVTQPAKTAPLARWTKPGASQEAFMRDRYVCIQQAQQHTSGIGSVVGTIVINRPLFVSCMAALGYVEDPNGNLYPPPGAVFPTTR